MIVVGAATAAESGHIRFFQLRPPHDCRWRGDCGGSATCNPSSPTGRLMIVVGAATAAIKVPADLRAMVVRLMIVVGAATAAAVCYTTLGGMFVRLMIVVGAATAAVLANSNKHGDWAAS